MKAVVFTESGEQLLDVPEPRPLADEVLVAVEYCGICGSDLHAAAPDFREGTVMGHEFAGVIVELGKDVAGWRVGQRVTINPNGDWCGRCPNCLVGDFNMCQHIWETAVGLARPGGLAPLTAVRSRVLRALPESATTKQGAWVEPTAVAVRSVHRSGISLGDDAIVFGGGPVGLLVTALLRSAGAGEITVVEISEARGQVAREVGADVVLDPTAVDVREHFGDTDHAPRFAFECTGVAEVTMQAVSVLHPHGRLIVNGFARRPPMYNAPELLAKEIEIVGSFIYVEEFDQAIDLLARGLVDIEPLTSGVVPVAHASEAFEAMRGSGSVIKYLIGSGGI